MIGLGIRSLMSQDSFQDNVTRSLGYKNDSFATIDQLNIRHDPPWLREYIEHEAFSTPLTWLDEYERNFIRVIPEGFSFDNPDGQKNWYYCPSCDAWLMPARVETVTKTRLADRRMKNGGHRIENGVTRHFGGQVDACIMKQVADRPDSVTVKWICLRCGEELPEAYATEIEAAPRSEGGEWGLRS
jgi:hypothetical protein